jgi:hypothetical protein
MTRLLILILLLGVLFLVYWYHDKFMGSANTTQNQISNTSSSGSQMNSDKKVTKLQFSDKSDKHIKNIKNSKNIKNKKKIEFIDPETESDELTFGSYDSKSQDSDDNDDDETYEKKYRNNRRNNKNDDESYDDSNQDEDFDEKSNMTGYSNFTLSDLK